MKNFMENIMKKTVQKLQIQRGASILLALMLFFVCFMVASVILSSATASADKMKARDASQKDYLALSSGADVLREVMGDVEFIGTETNTIYACIGATAALDPEKHKDVAAKCDEMSYKVVGDTARMRADIEKLVYEAFTAHTKFVPKAVVAATLSQEFEIVAKDMKPVLVKLNLDTKTYKITCILTVKGKAADDETAMTLRFMAGVVAPEKEAATVVVTKNDDHKIWTTLIDADNNVYSAWVETTYDVSVYTLETKVTYNKGTLSKGVES